MIRFVRVCKSYTQKDRSVVPVFAGLDLHIAAGELVCVLGASGCGKTTLLNLAAGFVFPTSGSVLFEGNPVQGPGPERGVVFQDATLFPWLTAYGNVAFALKQRGVRGQQLKETTSEYLAFMGLADQAHQYPCGLSGGMRQRVAIARVLALASRVLLMDEPFSALDAHSRERMQDELLRVHAHAGQTILYVTHSVAEAAYLGDRIILLGQRGVLLDIPVTVARPRRRSGEELLPVEEQLRACLRQEYTKEE
ncbi:MAG: ABC transporter ATP-binding protein [Desulfobulbus oligotrophicus]|jgi:NitT/TauT family transport system ATP-binding protein|nr:ABC transporter ATP-binding protein [Desulfobulbus oligotrophicus]